MSFLGDRFYCEALDERIRRERRDIAELGPRVALALYEENVGPEWERERVIQEAAA